MKKSDLSYIPEFYDTYINKVEDELTVNQALRAYDSDWLSKEKDDFLKLGDQVYAPNKWTVKDILQHMIDTERVFNYRALCIARGEGAELPGMDEQLYAQNHQAHKRSLDSLFQEFTLVREATIVMFQHFDKDMMLREGICFQKKVSVLSLGFTMVGHPIHHLSILKERYYLLIAK